jgi:adenylosuccinate synthase
LIFPELPRQAQRYLEILADSIDAKLWLVSVGPRRDQTITLPE